MSHDLTHLDLFSGIGGFAIAASLSGFRTVGFSEVDPYACRVLAERFPRVRNFGDVRKRDAFTGIGPVTVLTGGFPCQPFSEAGQRRGTEDDRYLWPAASELVGLIRPTWCIFENVVGIVDLALDEVCADLENKGYQTQTFDIPAGAVGAWHKRHRIWMVAHFEGKRTGGVPARPGHQGEGTTHDRRTLEERMDADIAGVRRKGRKKHGQFLEPQTRGEVIGARSKVGDLEASRSHAWAAAPSVLRMVHGVSYRAHRIKALGNAIVPQVVEPFFHWIAQIEKGLLK